MSNPVSIRMLGRVAVLSMDRPPVNSLGYDLRAGILAALDQVNTDPAVQIIVLTGTTRAFSAVADIMEFGTAQAAREPRGRRAGTMGRSCPWEVRDRGDRGAGE